jgi:Domain of unknown function (DUF3786)/Putative Fe-S cluster
MVGEGNREEIMKPVSAIELYKATPKTNCKACGFPTCLAFATRVIVEKKPLESCPYLGEELREELEKRITEQQSQGVYVKRDLYKITADHIRERLEPYDLAAIAQGLGAQYIEKDGQPHLRFSYLNRDCLVSKKSILVEGCPAEDHWDDILLYNYVFSSGNEPVRGEWIPIDNIPGHIPKKPELEEGCEGRVAAHFQGNPARLQRAGTALGGKRVEGASHADTALCFLPLPRVPFFLLFWDAAPEDGFEARAKVLFDRSVTNYLDIESLVFLARKFADALIRADESTGPPRAERTC